MDRYFQWLVMVGASFVLAACGTLRSSVVVEPAPGTAYRPTLASGTAAARTPIPGGSYTVLKSDTLYSIAFRNGVDFRDLAQWNQIAAPYTIWPGQHLRLSPDSHATSAAGAPVRPVPSTKPSMTSASPTTSPAPAAGAPMFEPVVPSAPAHAAIPPATTPTVAANSSMASAAPVSAGEPPVAAASAGVVPVAGVPTPAPTAVPPPVAPTAVPAAPSRAVSGLTWRWPASGAVAKRFQSTDAVPGIEISGKSGEPVRSAAEGVVVYSGNGLVGYGELVIIKHSDSLLSAYGHNRKRLVKEGQHVSAGQQIAEMGSTGASRNGLDFQIRKDGNPVDPLAYLPPR